MSRLYSIKGLWQEVLLEYNKFRDEELTIHHGDHLQLQGSDASCRLGESLLEATSHIIYP